MNKDTKKSPVAQREEETLARWNTNEVFKKSLEQTKSGEPFVFFDGPPFATGLPHHGHLLAGTIKDAIPRYQTMKGRYVRRKWGWDCHGLPIENLIEDEMGFENKQDIENFGIGKFNQAACDSVLRYDAEWKEIVPRMGRFVDMEESYKTMDWQYSESIWWAFKTLHEKGLIYKGYKSMHVCPRCETTLSNNEVAGEYKDIKDISITAKFELEDEPAQGGQAKTYVLAWTTTPWTLPGNVALAVGEDIDYLKMTVETSEVDEFIDEQTYIFARSTVKNIFDDTLHYGPLPHEGSYEWANVRYQKKGNVLFKNVQQIKGKDLVGKKYKPLFDYYSKDETLENHANGWKIYAADFVTTETGTGIVHIAPAFGEDDMNLGKAENLPFVQHVGMNGVFKKVVTDFAGTAVKTKDDNQSADIEIIKNLAGKGLLFSKLKLEHSYPHCWRCKTPLLNYAADSWFLEVTKIKDKMLEENTKINWVPESIGRARFANWVDGARDWAISRSRYWGAPFPVWNCDACEKTEVIGSLAELKEHGVTSEDEKGEVNLHRPYIDTVTWECSCGGTMKRVEDVFDCWFESGSMPYAQMHYPFENKELFKNNFPADFIAEGLDQTRGWFYTMLVLSVGLFDKAAYKNVIVNGTILAEDGLKMSKSQKNFPDPMDVVAKTGVDAFRYYLLASPVVHGESMSFVEKGVAEVYRKVVVRLENVLSFYEMYKSRFEGKVSGESPNVLDQWIVARTNQLIAQVSEGFDTYQLDKATRPIGEFVDDLSTWYIRRSRTRFKDGGVDAQYALATTKWVLETVSRVIAPTMPFIAEHVYASVGDAEAHESVHLASWPEAADVNDAVLSEMESVRRVVSLALENRATAKIKVRQPLQSLRVKDTTVMSNDLYVDLIKDEVNVKEIIHGKDIAEETELDTTITPELQAEGDVRDLIRHIQSLRKQSALTPDDTVGLIVKADKDGTTLLADTTATALVSKTALLSSIDFVDELEGEEVSVRGMTFVLGFKK